MRNVLANLLSRIKSPVLLNVLWLSLDQLSRLAIGLVVGIWIARYLGPQQWGEINYVLAIVSIVTTISNLGMDGFLVKQMLDQPAQKEEILGTASVTRLIFLPVCTFLALLYLAGSGAPASYYYLFAFLSPNFLVLPLDVIDLEFRSRLESKRTVIAKNIGYFLGAAIKMYLLITQKPMLWFAAAMGGEAILSYLFLLLSYQRGRDILSWRFRLNQVPTLLEAGWPFIISNMAVILYMKVDQLMIGQMAGEKELGLFSSASRITDLFTFIPMAVSSSYLAVLVKARQDNAHRVYIQKMQALFSWLAKGAVAIALLVTIVSPLLIHVLYGAKYQGAEKVLLVHIWSLIPIYLGVAAGQYMVIENLQRYNLYKTVIGLLLNIALNVVLIPAFGALGAATSTLVSYYVSALFSNCLFSATRPLFAYQVNSFRRLFSFKSQSTGD